MEVGRLGVVLLERRLCCRTDHILCQSLCGRGVIPCTMIPDPT